MKNFTSINLDSLSVSNTVPSSINITLPYSLFTHGSEDTIRFIARRLGCPGVASFHKTFIWSSNLNTPIINISPLTTTCNYKILTVTAPQAGVAYQWFEGNNQLVGNLNSTDTAFFPGSYHIKAVDNLFCQASSTTLAINYNAEKPRST